jgi:purine nucleosidase
LKKIAVDFDNTMGVPQCDVDDALALMFLLGNPELCKVKGICTTYGNSTLEVVHESTLKLVEKLKLDIPVLKGAATADSPKSEASDFLVKTSSENPGDLCVLATGSLTNLKGAFQTDPLFFENLSEISVMGGVLNALVIHGKILDELNLSCDPEATLEVLQASCPVEIAVSQHCFPCMVTKDQLVSEFGKDSWLLDACDNWFSTMDGRYSWSEFVCWDLVAAAQLIRPDLFEDDFREVVLYPRWLSVGLLETESMPGAPTATVNMPVIKDADAFMDAAIKAWHRVLDAI